MNFIPKFICDSLTKINKLTHRFIIFSRLPNSKTSLDNGNGERRSTFGNGVMQNRGSQAKD